VPDCAVILSALANVGSNDAGEIQKAFASRTVSRAPAACLGIIGARQCGVERSTPR